MNSSRPNRGEGLQLPLISLSDFLMLPTADLGVPFFQPAINAAGIERESDRGAEAVPRIPTRRLGNPI